MIFTIDIQRWLKRFFKKDQSVYLKKAKGVIHVGANTGQEREIYERYSLNVVWVEPIKEVYEVLCNNISNYKRQKAYRYLVTDKNGEEVTLNIANNFGMSSSILEIKDHNKIWPHVYYNDTVKMKTISLNRLVKIEEIDLDMYDVLIMDTQGSELLVLKGADGILNNFKFIMTEVADFESYRNCCKVKDVENFVKIYGFVEYSRSLITSGRDCGSYYNIVYKKKEF